MGQDLAAPRDLLARWLVQLRNPQQPGPNWIRRIEQRSDTIRRDDNGKFLCGFEIAENLYLTRQRVFLKVLGKRAVPISLEEVAANYNLEAMQAKYRTATEAWKSRQRRA